MEKDKKVFRSRVSVLMLIFIFVPFALILKTGYMLLVPLIILVATYLLYSCCFSG
jgi:hypothetical protein